MRFPLLALLLICGCVNLMAFQKGDTAFSLKARYMDKYLFRGHLFHDDPAYQGEFGVGIASWSYNLVYTETDAGGSDALPFSGLEREYNHSVNFTTVQGRRVTTIGYQYYDYQGLGIDTQEFFVRVTSPGSRWNPTYGVTFDIDAYKGYYFDFSLTRSFAVSARSSFLVSLRTALSYEMDEKTNDQGVVTEHGFYEDDGFAHSALVAKYVWLIGRRMKFEGEYLYHYAHDDGLYDDVIVDRDFGTWQAGISITFP